MKRIVLFLMIIMMNVSYSQDTLPVIPFGDRKPDLYYWDTNWVDHYQHLHPNTEVYPYSKLHTIYSDFFPEYLGRACIADEPLNLIGIAGVVGFHIPISNGDTLLLDITMEGRVPEYFMMYDGNYNLLARVRWDNKEPAYRMEFRSGGHRDTLNVYEAYFDSIDPVSGKIVPISVGVEGLFYVGGTQYNNLEYGNNFEAPWWPGYYEHIQTEYGGHEKNANIAPAPYPNHYIVRPLWPSRFHYLDGALGDPSQLQDTTVFEIRSTDIFWCFFPIFDTTSTTPGGDTIPDSCAVPTGLRVQIMSGNSAIVRWDHSDVGMWELSVWRDGDSEESATVTQSQVELVDLGELDTGTVYVARLRAVCDSGNASEWTDTIHFSIPGTGGGDASIDEDVIGRYTHLMPNPAGDRVTLLSSFRMRKVELFNMEGKRVACHEANGLSTILDLSGYASGTYIVRIITQSGVTTKRLIKK